MNTTVPINFCSRYFFDGWKELFFRNRPIFVTFFITARCNAHCEHCFYWQHAGRKECELTLSEIAKISHSLGRFPKLLLSGGEPFLREDIDEICKLFYLNNNVRQLTIPTNGILSDKIYVKTENILKSCVKASIQLQISIDGLWQIHNRIRNSPGAFDKMLETYHLLKKLEKTYKSFEINFCFTFSASNQDGVGDVYEFIKKLTGYSNLNLLLVRPPVKNEDLLRVDFSKYKKWSEIIICETLAKRTNFSEYIFALRQKWQLKMIDKVVKDKGFLFKCTAGTLTAVIDEIGQVYPCEMSKLVLGALREENYDFSKIWHDKAACLFREKATCRGCRCTHESNIITNISFSPGAYFELLKEYLKGAKV